MTTSNVLEERLQNRRRRRWNRRARILAPFLALPLLLATLLISVDIVEYRPEGPDTKPTVPSIDGDPLEARSAYSTQAAISTAAHVAQIPMAGFESEAGIPFVVDLDLDLDLPRLQAQTLGTSTTPYAPRR